MQVNSQYKNNPNFTSLIPTRVVINNHVAISPENVKKAVRGLQKILTSPANGNETLRGIKTTFCNTVKDFQYFAGAKYESGTLIRNITDTDIAKFTDRTPDSGLAYLFTGDEALELAQKGKTIGPERTKSDGYFERFGNFATKIAAKTKKTLTQRNRSFEELEKDITYYDKIKEFLSKPKLFVKSSGNGSPVELIINATKGKDGKINVNSIGFKSLVQPAEKPTEKAEIKPVIESKTKRIKKRLKKIINDGQLSLF